MKTILVPTDFSKASQNAVDYAIKMAKEINAKLILFHAYHTPAVAFEIPVEVYPSMDEIEKDALKALMLIKSNIPENIINSTNIECVCKRGFAVDLINEYVTDNKIDLIIMGMQGAGYFVEKLVGSITTSVISDGKCPVIAIAEQVKFKVPENILFACDYKKVKKSVLWPLKDFATLFKSHLFILNVSAQEEEKNTENTEFKLLLNETFSDIKHSFHHSIDKNVFDAITDFISENNADLVVMIPRELPPLENIFHQSLTKKMAFHSSIPLIALHEKLNL